MKHRTSRSPWTVATAAAVLLTACGGAAGTQSTSGGAATAVKMAADQTLRLAAGRQPRSLDPALATSPLFPHLYSEALLAPNQDDSGVVGAAAQSYDVSQDGLTVTFHLRGDGRFNDGRPVTAQDFVYAWRRLIDPRVAAPNAQVFAGAVAGGRAAAKIDPKTGADRIAAALDGLGLKAPDAQTFVVTLDHPDPAFPWIATLVDGAPVRQDVVEKGGAAWATSPDTLVTNGVFRLSSIAQGQSLTFTPNPGYRVKPKLQSIVISIAPAAAEWTRYLNNEADVAYPPEAQIHAAATDPTLAQQIVRDPQPSVEWTTFNTAKAPFDNVKVRQAFADAVDRRAYVAALLPDGEAEPMTTLVPRGMTGYDASLPGAQQFDPARAKSDLAASGVTAAQLQGIHVLTGSYFVNQTEFLRDQLQKNLGVTVTIDSIGDFGALTDRVTRGDFQMYDLDYLNVPYPDPSPLFDLFLSSSPVNDPRWANQEYDSLVGKADTTSDPAQRRQLYAQAETLLLQQAPISMLYQFNNIMWMKPWVRGVVTNAFDDTGLPGDLHLTTIYIAQH